MKLSKRYFIFPIATLSLLTGLWVTNHSHIASYASRSIASGEVPVEAKKEIVDDKVKNLEDLVACQKKVIADLKDDMAKKIDDLKKIVNDYDKKQDKKKVEQKDDVKISEAPSMDPQTLALLMHLTSLIQNRQMHSLPQMSMSYMPAYEQSTPQNSFYREFYENSMFYDQIGMGRSYLQQPVQRFYPMGGFNNFQQSYQNPYEVQRPEHFVSQIPNNLQRMPMLGDEFNFSQNNNLVRQPSSGGFQF